MTNDTVHDPYHDPHEHERDLRLFLKDLSDVCRKYQMVINPDASADDESNLHDWLSICRWEYDEQDAYVEHEMLTIDEIDTLSLNELLEALPELPPAPRPDLQAVEPESEIFEQTITDLIPTSMYAYPMSMSHTRTGKIGEGTCIFFDKAHNRTSIEYEGRPEAATAYLTSSIEWQQPDDDGNELPNPDQ